MCQAQAIDTGRAKRNWQELRGSQQAAGQGQEADNVCLGSWPKRGRLLGIHKYTRTKELTNKKGAEGDRTMEQWNSKERNPHWCAFHPGEGRTLPPRLWKGSKNGKWGKRLFPSSPVTSNAPGKCQSTCSLEIPRILQVPWPYLVLFTFISLNQIVLFQSHKCFSPVKTWCKHSAVTYFRMTFLVNKVIIARGRPWSL